MDRSMEPMLCATADLVPEGDEWVLEPKFDGWRIVAHVTGRGVIVYGGRNGNDYSGKVPYIEDALRATLPDDSVVDGELVSMSGWGDVQGAMTRNGPHQPARESEYLTLVLFDVLRVNGLDARSLKWEERRALLDKVTIRSADELILQRTHTFDSTARAHQIALTLGFEGTVSKRRDARYTNGRSPNWVKVKPQETAEAIVRGFKDGEGNFEGLVGALEIEMLDEQGNPNGVMTRCSGFNMKTRANITDNKTQWTGKVIEIKHHGIGKTGAPRHPQFNRLRDDRAPTPKKPRTASAPRAGGQRRRRNYSAMTDVKLRECINDLKAGAGEHYSKCIDRGSGDPDGDLAHARDIARQRGWSNVP